MKRNIHLLSVLMMIGILFLGIHNPAHSSGEATAEPTAETAQAIPTELSGKMVFVELVKNGSQIKTQIYSMNADGSNIRQLTIGDRNPWSPALSPDGQQIAFVAKVDQRYQIFLMDGDGTNEKQLTQFVTGQTSASWLDWSPDGKQILFTHKISDDPKNQSYDLNMMNSDGTEQHQIMTQTMENLVTPHWSPDSKQIVFGAHGNSLEGPTKSVDTNTKTHLYIINADGTHLHRLSLSDNEELFPAWSFDGKSIFFQSYGTSANDSGLFRTNYDGSNLTQIIGSSYTMPTSSPDGKYLAVIYPEFKNGKTVSNIYVMNPDGSNPIKLTDTDNQYLILTWSK
jgi:Tol biopolymer transport system component